MCIGPHTIPFRETRKTSTQTFCRPWVESQKNAREPPVQKAIDKAPPPHSFTSFDHAATACACAPLNAGRAVGGCIWGITAVNTTERRAVIEVCEEKFESAKGVSGSREGGRCTCLGNDRLGLTHQEPSSSRGLGLLRIIGVDRGLGCSGLGALIPLVVISLLNHSTHSIIVHSSYSHHIPPIIPLVRDPRRRDTRLHELICNLIGILHPLTRIARLLLGQEP